MMSSGFERLDLPLSLLRRRAEEGVVNLASLIAAAEKAAMSALSGHHPHRRTGSGEKFWQFRNYDPADRPQDIDWRQSGKGDNVFVRQKELQTRQTILLWCAGDPGMSYSSSPQFPHKITATATLALASAIIGMRTEDSVGLLDKSISANRTEQTLESIATSCLQGKNASLPPSGAIPPKNACVILIGDFLDPIEAIETAFAPLAARTANGIVFQVLDPSEISLPFSGRALFRNPHGGADIIVPNVESVREIYRQKIETHIQSVAALCHRYRWRHILHTTDMPLHETLMKAGA